MSLEKLKQFAREYAEGARRASGTKAKDVDHKFRSYRMSEKSTIRRSKRQLEPEHTDDLQETAWTYADNVHTVVEGLKLVNLKKSKGWFIDDQRLDRDPKAFQELFQSLTSKLADNSKDEGDPVRIITDSLKKYASDYDDYERNRITQICDDVLEAVYQAITGRSRSDIICSRSDPSAINAGINITRIPNPSEDDAKNAKSYLTDDEWLLLLMIKDMWLKFTAILHFKNKKLSLMTLFIRFNEIVSMCRFQESGPTKYTGLAEAKRTGEDNLKEYLRKGRSEEGSTKQRQEDSSHVNSQSPMFASKPEPE